MICHCCALVITQVRTRIKKWFSKYIHGWVHSVQRVLLLNFVVLAVLLYKAYINLWPSGLYVLKITLIMWKNNGTVQTAVILNCMLRFSNYRCWYFISFDKSLTWCPKLGRWNNYTYLNLITYLYYPSVGHTKSLLVVWLKFCIHSCF